jgi:hypothetical protein
MSSNEGMPQSLLVPMVFVDLLFHELCLFSQATRMRVLVDPTFSNNSIMCQRAIVLSRVPPVLYRSFPSLMIHHRRTISSSSPLARHTSSPSSSITSMPPALSHRPNSSIHSFRYSSSWCCNVVPEGYGKVAVKYRQRIRTHAKKADSKL